MFIILKNYVYECVRVFVCTLCFFHMQMSSKGKVGFQQVKQGSTAQLYLQALIPHTFDF